MADKDKEKDFTEREMVIMAKAWTCMKAEPAVDYKKLAEACGMSNVGSATNAWAKIKKKILLHAGAGEENSDAATPKPTPKSTPRKRGKKAEGEDKDDDESPAKKPKVRKAKAEAKVEDGEEKSASESPVKKEKVEEDDEVDA